MRGGACGDKERSQARSNLVQRITFPPLDLFDSGAEICFPTSGVRCYRRASGGLERNYMRFQSEWVDKLCHGCDLIKILLLLARIQRKILTYGMTESGRGWMSCGSSTFEPSRRLGDLISGMLATAAYWAKEQ